MPLPQACLWHNEAGCFLQDQIKGYKALYGYYPALVLADKIYWTRANRKYLKDRNIKSGATPLGRRASLTKNEKDKRRKINNKRSEIEGKFGQTKLKYGLDDLFTRLPETSMAEINRSAELTPKPDLPGCQPLEGAGGSFYIYF